MSHSEEPEKPKKLKGAWSIAKEARKRRRERREKRERKRAYIAQKKAEEFTRLLQEARKESGLDMTGHSDEDDDDEMDEWAELQREERLAKKLKRGKITQDEFDRQVGLADLD
jgi:ATP-dependent RNA helicase DDX55/SPB4